MELACKIGLRVVFIFMLVRCYPEPPPIIDKPSAGLTAEGVVIAHIVALQNNNEPHKNAGIQIAYNFASPYQKLEHETYYQYETLYTSRQFTALINNSSYFIKRHFENKKKAEYFVFITDREGYERIYLFQLSKQSASPYTDCWMTDSIKGFEDESIVSGEYYMASL